MLYVYEMIFNEIVKGTKVPWQIAQIALKYEAYGNYVMQNFQFNFPQPPHKKFNKFGYVSKQCSNIL